MDVPSGWRVSVLLQLVPGVALAAGMLALPQSPRWLVSRGRRVEAAAALRRVRAPDDDVSAEVRSMAASYALEMASGEPSWREFASGPTRRVAAVGVALQLLQQLSGMNVLMYYGPRIFEQLGASGFLFAALSGVVNFLATFPAIVLVDRVGRTVLLRWSAVGMALSCFVLASVGDICPTSPRCAHLASGAVFFFIFSFAFGWGPVVWVYCAEIFPLKYRSRAAGLTTAANWVGNTLIGFFPPLLISAIGLDTFWIFGGCCVACLAASCVLPETRGQSLEEVTAALAAPTRTARRAADCNVGSDACFRATDLERPHPPSGGGGEPSTSCTFSPCPRAGGWSFRHRPPQQGSCLKL